MNKEEQLKVDIAKLIDQNPDFYFTGGVDEDRIKQTEKVLGVTFPESYKWFLKKYGTSTSIYGIGLSETPAVVKHTLNYREFGLPKSFVVIKDVGEWVYCLDTGRMKNNECPVIDWDIRGESHRLFENFYIFIKNELESEIENL